jgi:glycyl-tRNA synthetase
MYTNILAVFDEKIDGECFQANHLIKAQLKKIVADNKTTAEVRLECEDIALKLDGMDAYEMEEVIERFKMKSPISGNNLSEAIEYPLMFGVNLYKEDGTAWGYLRPELSQGIFVNFKRLLDSNQVIISPQKLWKSLMTDR